jgi:MFS superfamily sulfate permease-like transporter
MELDELKYQLNTKLSGEGNKTIEDLSGMLYRRRSTLVSRLTKNLYLEMGLALLFGAIFIYLANQSRLFTLQTGFSIIAVVCFVFAIAIALLIKQVASLNNKAHPLKTSLESLIKILRLFVKRYFQFIVLLVPVCFFLSYWIGYNEPVRPQYMQSFSNVNPLLSDAKVYLFFVVYGIVIIAGVFVFARWYLKKLYVNYINELRLQLKDLKEN